MKKKGFSLVELVVVIFIVAVIGSTSLIINVEMGRSLYRASKEREEEECFKAIVNEVRYNLDREKFNDKKVDNKVILPYKEGLLEELVSSNLLDIDGSHDYGTITILYNEDEDEYEVGLKVGERTLESKVKERLE